MSLSRASRAKLIVAASIGSVALTLAFSRCSPLATSFDKGMHGGALGSGPLGAPGSLPGSIHVFVYKTRVMDGESYASTVTPLPTGQKLVLGASDQADKLEEFKTNERVQIALPATFAPDEGSGYFEVAFTSTDLSSFDLSAFETMFRPVADGVWQLSVSPTVPADLARRVLDGLMEITIYVNTQVPATPSATPPSPAPAALSAPTGITGASAPSGAASPVPR